MLYFKNKYLCALTPHTAIFKINKNLIRGLERPRFIRQVAEFGRATSTNTTVGY